MSSKSLFVAVVLSASSFVVPAARAQASRAPRPSASAAAPSRSGQQVIDVAVTADGFVPSRTNVKVGTPVTLRITRKVERTCATDVVIGAFGIRRALPLNETVEVTFTPTRPGKIRFACAMDMIAGELVAE